MCTCISGKEHPLPLFRINNQIYFLRFFPQARSGIPNIIGAIDGSHIRVPPPKHLQHSYYNRKSFYSIILSAIVDPRGAFMSCDIGSVTQHCPISLLAPSFIAFFPRWHIHRTFLGFLVVCRTRRCSSIALFGASQKTGSVVLVSTSTGMLHTHFENGLW